MASLLTVFIISPAMDEVIATSHFLVRSRRAGRPFWRTFWQGDSEPRSLEEPRAARSLPRELAGGMELSSIPWNLIICAGLGVWLIIAPSMLGLTGRAVWNNSLVGALVATLAVIGFGEAIRPARLLNVPLGLWLGGSPMVLWDDTSDPHWPEVAAGIAIIL